MTLWYIVDIDTRKVVDIFNYSGYGKRPMYKSGTWQKVNLYYKNQNKYDIVYI